MKGHRPSGWLNVKRCKRKKDGDDDRAKVCRGEVGDPRDSFLLYLLSGIGGVLPVHPTYVLFRNTKIRDSKTAANNGVVLNWTVLTNLKKKSFSVPE